MYLGCRFSWIFAAIKKSQTWPSRQTRRSSCEISVNSALLFRTWEYFIKPEGSLFEENQCRLRFASQNHRKQKINYAATGGARIRILHIAFAEVRWWTEMPASDFVVLFGTTGKWHGNRVDESFAGTTTRRALRDQVANEDSRSYQFAIHQWAHTKSTKHFE